MACLGASETGHEVPSWGLLDSLGPKPPNLHFQSPPRDCLLGATGRPQPASRKVSHHTEALGPGSNLGSDLSFPRFLVDL